MYVAMPDCGTTLTAPAAVSHRPRLGAYRTVDYGVRPLGAVLGGRPGATIGLRDALWVAAAGASCAGVPLLRRAVLNLRSAAPPDQARQATVV